MAADNAPAAKEPSRHVGLRIALAIIVLVVGAVGIFVLIDRLSEDHSISRVQWQGVKMGAGQQEVIDRLDTDPSETQTTGGTSAIFYENSGDKVVAEFDFRGGRLVYKEWRKAELSETTITAAERHSVPSDATSARIVRRLGKPAERADRVTNARFFAAQLRRQLGVTGTRRSRCIAYLWAPNRSRTVEFCFDAKTGRPLN
jgi:hypothetical protein